MEFHFEKGRLLIVGDVMLDKYWFGDTSRISPEAPVPVVKMKRMEERAGGAANVAMGVKALNATPCLLGIVGMDEAALQLKNVLTENEIDHHFVTAKTESTITKVRVLSRNQQILRVDTEKSFSMEDSQSLDASYLQALKHVNAVILSDYGKGTLKHIRSFIQQARARQIPVIVDPKSADYNLYRDVNVITPNLKELEAVIGPSETLEQMVEKTRHLLETFNIDALVVTRSEKGLSVIIKNGEAAHIPALAREVHDVTGAGDTVIAVLATALASGVPLIESAAIANVAAGLVVSKLGASTITQQELEIAYRGDETLPLGSLPADKLMQAIHLSKSRGERIVFTNGCFDILHAGHVLYLEQAKRLGDRVVVALNDDASVKRLKGESRPLNALADRMSVIAALKSVDWVTSFSEDTPERIIREISPHVLVKGGDYKDPESLAGARHVLSQGGRVEILGLKEGCSTTQLIHKALAQNTPEEVSEV